MTNINESTQEEKCSQSEKPRWTPKPPEIEYVYDDSPENEILLERAYDILFRALMRAEKNDKK